MKKIRIAFIYGYEPSGHAMAAKAIADFLPGITEPCFFNISEIYPRLGPFVAKVYLEMLHKAPHLWGYLYDRDYIFKATKKIKNAVIPFCDGKIGKLLKKKGISAVVSTHALSSIMFSRKSGTERQIPHFAVLTDFYAHSYWPTKGIELYFVPNEETKKSLVSKKAHPSKIMVTGIPIRKEFINFSDPAAAKRELGLNPEIPAVLVTGGTRGLGGINSLFAEIAKMSDKLQAVFVCGTNRKLYSELKGKARRLGNISVAGFAANMSKFHMASDAIIGKPGGITIAEALAMRKPLGIFRPLPGQEEKNTEFLTRHKLAVHLKTSAQITHFLRETARGNAPRPSLGKLARFSMPLAANSIASEIVSRILVKRA